MILAKVRRTISERALIERGDFVIVACSGGPDSIAMTHVLSRIAQDVGITVLVASVDHGLRPESAKEVQGVGQFARSLSLPFRALTVEIATKASIQAEARTVRYAALRELARQENANRIAVGHTMEDQAETVMSRLLRGSGLRGLSGIAPRREDGVIRPLLDCRRADVLGYVQHHALPFIVDASNANRRFERVQIRLDVLPVLERVDPQVIPHLAALADDARNANDFLEERAKLLLDQCKIAEDSSLRVDLLLEAPVVVRQLALFSWSREFIPRELGRSHIESLEALIFSGKGTVLLPEGWHVVTESGCVKAQKRLSAR